MYDAAPHSIFCLNLHPRTSSSSSDYPPKLRQLWDGLNNCQKKWNPSSSVLFYSTQSAFLPSKAPEGSNKNLKTTDRRSFPFSAPRVCSFLSIHPRSFPDISIFNSRLKTYHFNPSFNSQCSATSLVHLLSVCSLYLLYMMQCLLYYEHQYIFCEWLIVWMNEWIFWRIECLLLSRNAR